MAKRKGMRGLDGSTVRSTDVAKSRSFVITQSRAKRPDYVPQVFPVSHEVVDEFSPGFGMSKREHLNNKRIISPPITAGLTFCQYCDVESGYCLCESLLADIYNERGM